MSQLQRLAVRSAALRVRASPLSLASRTLPWSIPSPPPSSSSSPAAPRARMVSTTPDDTLDAPLVLPYKAKKVWPPDFSRLSPQEQLRFEKRYKRRVAIRSERPRWVKFIKLVQLFSVTFVVIYGVLFMEWEYGPQPFEGIRAWFWETLGSVTGGQGRAVREAGETGDSSASGESVKGVKTR